MIFVNRFKIVIGKFIKNTTTAWDRRNLLKMLINIFINVENMTDIKMKQFIGKFYHEQKDNQIVDVSLLDDVFRKNS